MDYKKLGFKSGLEIHQQLEGKKLFCSCKTEIRKSKPDFTFNRKLRASAGESGKVDIAAAHEQAKGKLFTYWGYDDINCLVEMDEEPPGPINQEALQTALQVSLMLNCKIVDCVQVMRKTVVDGSNVSGFQRTALIGRDGFIMVGDKKIRVSSVCLEEEACQVMTRTKEHDTYNLSRLGIPLLEIATEPDISNPEECKEAAGIIGMVLRSTGACKRGIGSIRQDVNISIKGGARTEIKGFQDLKSIPKVVDNEIKRQQNLIDKKKKIETQVRKAESDFTTSFLRPMPGAARMYPETDVPKIPIGNLEKIELPELISDKLNEFEKKYGLTKEKIQTLQKAKLWKVFEKSFNENIKAAFIADTLLSYESELEKNKSDPGKIKPELFIEIFGHLSKNKISKDSILQILIDVGQGKKFDIKNYELEDINLEKEVAEVIAKNPNAPIGALMGMLMGKFRGKVDGKALMDELKKQAK